MGKGQGVGEREHKGDKETFEGDGYVHYLDDGGVFMGVCVCIYAHTHIHTYKCVCVKTYHLNMCNLVCQIHISKPVVCVCVCVGLMKGRIGT